MQISRTFIYKTFNPNTNDFDKKAKTVWKEVDKGTVKKLKIFNIIRVICLWLLFPSLLGALICGVCAEEVSLWFLFGFFGSLFLLIFCLCYATDMNNKEDAIYEEFRSTAFDQEDIECGAYNDEQKVIANQWRKEHLFEEKIRMVQTRGSSVDVAEMIKEYIKMQKGE